MRGTPQTHWGYVARGEAKRAEARGGLAVHTQGGVYTRWCTHKAVQTQGSLWPPQESCYFRGAGGKLRANCRKMGKFCGTCREIAIP